MSELEKILAAAEQELLNSKEPNIFDKYRHLIIKANDGFLNRFNYGEIMEILRFCEKKVGHNIPININCGNCIIDLVKLFSRFENK